MEPCDITFSINQYDKDGDIVNEGVFIHFGETTIKVSETITEFSNVVDHFQVIRQEIINRDY